MRITKNPPWFLVFESQSPFPRFAIKYPMMGIDNKTAKLYLYIINILT
jgi:hypothetical protein